MRGNWEEFKKMPNRKRDRTRWVPAFAGMRARWL